MTILKLIQVASLSMILTLGINGASAFADGHPSQSQHPQYKGEHPAPNGEHNPEYKGGEHPSQANQDKGSEHGGGYKPELQHGFKAE
jgi:hypothetical protein